MQDRLYIIVLNYNNWADTLACAQSILASDYQDFTLVIVDNASSDGSMDYLRKWARGELESWSPPKDSLRALSFAPRQAPLDFVYYRQEALLQNDLTDAKVVLIESEQNGGYSAGNNLGIQYAKMRGDYGYVWILNNDTVVRRDTLTHLMACAARAPKNTGLMGTTLLFYDAPWQIQAFGARFNRFFAVQKHYLAHQPYTKKLVEEFDQTKIDYIIGASMLLSRECIEKIGLMPEEYFIYFEEIDIATNCKRHGFKMQICTDAIVYHKESVTIKQQNRQTSAFSDFYAMRNRVLVTRKYYPKLLLAVYVGLVLSMCLRLWRGEFDRVRNIVRILKTRPQKVAALRYRLSAKEEQS